MVVQVAIASSQWLALVISHCQLLEMKVANGEQQVPLAPLLLLAHLMNL